jgi:esterase/lipase superfamily enzyme
VAKFNSSRYQAEASFIRSAGIISYKLGGDILVYKKVISILFLALAVSMTISCAGLQPIPVEAYGEEGATLFENLPTPLKSAEVDVLYATDRAPDSDQEVLLYGNDRSFSLAFGFARVKLGKDLSWDDLVNWSQSQNPEPVDIEPFVTSVTEVVRLPSSPYPYELNKNGQLILGAQFSQQLNTAQETIQNTIRKRLKLTERKNIYIHVHGIKSQLGDTLIDAALTYHLYGRQGVPIVYSWPAGQRGLLRGYTGDRESGEFTVFHLKEFIRTVAAIDEVEKINFTAHSRGTDVILTALRELIIEARASGKDPHRSLKLSNLILIAPDIDASVASQRVIAEALTFSLDRITVYTNDHDGAIAIATKLFASSQRLGNYDVSEVTERQKESLQRLRNADIIFYSGKGGGLLKHSYYQSPAMLADYFLLLEGKKPGASNGRPLEPLGEYMWGIDDNYLK